MTSIVAANRRDRKKASTRKSIVAAALDLFEASGYDNVTVDQIAEQSDVSPRTVYRYFPTKSAMVFEVQASWMAVFQKMVAHPRGSTTSVVIRQSSSCARSIVHSTIARTGSLA